VGSKPSIIIPAIVPLVIPAIFWRNPSSTPWEVRLKNFFHFRQDSCELLSLLTLSLRPAGVDSRQLLSPFNFSLWPAGSARLAVQGHSLIVTALGDSMAAMTRTKHGTAKLPEDQIPARTDTTPSWAITPEKIEAAVRRIVRTAQPRKIIIFGSAVRGEAGIHSDLDILVVTKDGGESSRKESVRIRRALRGISMPMDILVIPERELGQLARRPGLVYREAIRHGRVVYDAAA